MPDDTPDFGTASAVADAPDFGQDSDLPDFTQTLKPPLGFPDWETYEKAREQYTESQGSSDFLRAVGSDPKGFLKSLPADAAQLIEQGGAAALNTLRKVNQAGMPWEKPAMQPRFGAPGGVEDTSFKPGVPIWQPKGTVLQPEGNDLEKIWSSFLTPGNIVTFPFAGAKPSRLIFWPKPRREPLMQR